MAILALMPHHQMAEFKLLHSLAHAKALKKRPSPSTYGPQHRIALVGLERRVYRLRRNVKTAFRRYNHFAPEEIIVCPYFLHYFSVPPAFVLRQSAAYARQQSAG